MALPNSPAQVCLGVDLLENTLLWHLCLWSPTPRGWPAGAASLAKCGAGEVEPAPQEPADTQKGNPVSPSKAESRYGEDCLLPASVSPPEFQGLFQLLPSSPSLSSKP